MRIVTFNKRMYFENIFACIIFTRINSLKINFFEVPQNIDVAIKKMNKYTTNKISKLCECY